MKKTLSVVCSTLLLAGTLPAAAQSPAALTRIGAAAAVKGSVLAKAPGTQVGRVVESGKPLFLNDHVTTNAQGRLQILLLDETAFTIGPDSDLTLDEFVYDPATDAGKVTARVTKGVFRFVTGKVARKDPSRMNVKLPVGTIGIRGTMALGQVDGSGSTVILLGPGSMNNAGETVGAIAVQNAGADVLLTRPGFGTNIQPGQPPSPPADMSQQAVKIIAALQPPPPANSPAPPATGGGGQSASNASGNSTAEAGSAVKTFFSLADANEETTKDLTEATQDAAEASGLADGMAKWEDINRSLSSIETYSASGGQYNCTATGSMCTMGASGSVSLSLDINFGTHEIVSGTIDLGPAGSFDPSPASFNTLSFSGYTIGPAVMPVTILGGSFINPTLTFMNQGGTLAKDAIVNFNYNDGLDQAVGSGKATVAASPNDRMSGASIHKDGPRPWGDWKALADEPGFKVKRITVLPGERTSYQTHARRREHWTVVDGRATVTLDRRDIPLAYGEHFVVPLGAPHRIANPHGKPLVFIEVQTGDYLGEDDIVRIEDDYGRTGGTP